MSFFVPSPSRVYALWVEGQACPESRYSFDRLRTNGVEGVGMGYF